MNAATQETWTKRFPIAMIVALAFTVTLSLLATTQHWKGLKQSSMMASNTRSRLADMEDSSDLFKDTDELLKETQLMRQYISELESKVREHAEGCHSSDASFPIRLKSTVERSSWCPHAKCRKYPLCDACQRRFLMVITNGRSASTTLTWMLDRLPGVRMAGENNNAIGNIMQMIRRTTKKPFSFRPGRRDNKPWAHNPIPDGSFACVAQSMIETINPPRMNANETMLLVKPQQAQNMIIGFKTIRLLAEGVTMDQVPEIVKFLKIHFPCSRYLINYRSDMKSQAESQTHLFAKYNGQSMDKALARLNEEIARLKELARLLGDSAMVIDSAEWTKDVSALNKAVKWLGFDDSCAFQSVLELNTEGKGYGNGKTELRLDPDCRYVGR